MGIEKDLTGKKFGMLTVLEETGQKDKCGSYIWKCQCSCENHTICYKSARCLGSKTGVRSCGCLKSKKVSEMKKIDITGQKFHRLTAIRPTGEKNKWGSYIWECRCDCGSSKIVYSTPHDLRRCHTCSCGCLRSKGEAKIGEIFRQNKINFTEQKSFDNCRYSKTGTLLYFDFYLPDYNCCIEYDGEQHFKETFFSHDNLAERQDRDFEKSCYCLENDIFLIRIPYTHYKYLSIEDLLPDTSNFVANREAMGKE